MEKYLPNNVGIIATHPMFGPDSFMSNNRLKMMMNNTKDSQNQFKFWKGFFKDQGIQILEMTPDEHDRMAAQTQGVTHFLGRMLKEFGIKKTSIDTQGFRDLLDLVDQTCNDTWELYTDLQLFNPYTKSMIKNLKDSTNKLDNRLKELQS
jgi:prephenate dehydrogenase